MNLRKTKKPQVIKLAAFKMVGVAELESATPCVSCKMVGVAELESATPCVSCKKCFFELNKL